MVGFGGKQHIRIALVCERCGAHSGCSTIGRNKFRKRHAECKGTSISYVCPMCGRAAGIVMHDGKPARSLIRPLQFDRFVAVRDEVKRQCSAS